MLFDIVGSIRWTSARVYPTPATGIAFELITEEDYDPSTSSRQVHGNRTRLVEAVDTEFERKTEYAYTDGNLTSIIKYLDESTTVETTMEYDEDGILKKKIDPSGETSYTYTEDGNIDTVTTAQGTWEYEYDAEGRLSTITDPFSHTRSREYDEDGNVKAVKVNGETVSTYTYDADGNLIQRTDAEGNVYTFDYNADGQLVGQSDPEGAAFHYVYDENGRLEKTIDGNGNVIMREYGVTETSSSGSCTSCGSTPLLGGAGVGERLQKIIYPTFIKEFRYDDEGRVSEEMYTFNGGETYSVYFDYDVFGRLQSTTGPDNRSTTYFYDLMGRRIRVEDPSGATKFEYDNWDNLIALTDAKNQRTAFEYDTLSRLKTEIRPMSQETTYEYNEKGQLWKMVDAKNQMTEYGYDGQGRLETISYADGKTVILNYDPDGNLAGYSDGETSAEYEYDDLGRKIWEKVNYGDFTKEFSYTYYKNGLKKTLTMPDGTMYEYAYGNNNELREVQIPGLGAVTIPDYTWNRPAKMTFPGGTQRTYGYDALMRLQALTVTDPGGNPLLDYQYTYHEVGNIMTKATEHGNYTYDYDASSRLTGVDNPVLDDESYTYDDVGNRLTSADVSGSWSYNANNELLGFADVEYEYDENGNMTEVRIGSSVVWTYMYDAANRLVHVEDGTGTISADYYYDPFGRRLWKEVGGERTYFFYSDEGLVGEYDETGAEIKSYGYKPDSTWTTDPLFMKQGTEYYFYQNDHLGTPQKLVGANGAVVWSAVYSSFGKADVQVETVTNNLRFPGMFFDAETGLHYNFHRYYDPKIGRYLRVDPIGFTAGDMNLYGYVQSNPLKSIDPNGLSKKEDIAKNWLDYSCNCGWIDWTHATPGAVDGSFYTLWGGFSGIDSNVGRFKSATGKGFKILYGQKMNAGPIYAFYEREYFVKYNLSLPERESVALAIFQEVSVGFEGMQAGFPYGWVINSGFSEEDLPSDLIAFYRAVKGYRRPYIEKLCGIISNSQAEELWDEIGGLKQIKPYSWKPQNYNYLTCGCLLNEMKWPEELDEIKPAPKGKVGMPWQDYLWRDWDYSIDGPFLNPGAGW